MKAKLPRSFVISDLLAQYFNVEKETIRITLPVSRTITKRRPNHLLCLIEEKKIQLEQVEAAVQPQKSTHSVADG